MNLLVENQPLALTAVLFTGLTFSTIEPGITGPPLIYVLGPGLLADTMGLESGPDFFKSLKSTGLRNNGFALGAIVDTNTPAMVAKIIAARALLFLLV